MIDKRIIWFAWLPVWLSGCLFPGSPKTFNYGNKKNGSAITAISYPRYIDFEYRYHGAADSVLFYDHKAGGLKRMSAAPETAAFTYRRREKIINSNLRRMNRLDTLFIHRHKGQHVFVDTLIKTAPTRSH